MNKVLIVITSLIFFLMCGNIECIASQYSGTCGDHAEWTFQNGVLTITGNGDMWDFDFIESEEESDEEDETGDEPEEIDPADYFLPGWVDFSDEIKLVVIKTGITGTGRFSLAGLVNMTRVSIAETVEEIGEYTFYNCSKITDISIPESVSFIYDYAFSGCVGLTSIDLPDDLSELGAGAFWGCYNLESITIPTGITSLGHHMFSSCKSLVSIQVPENITSIGAVVFDQCNNLVKISLPDSITSIPNSAFSSCWCLKEINIPDSVTSIEAGAFYSCSSLSSLTLPDNITSITKGTFDRCPATLYATIGSTTARALGRADYSFRYANADYIYDGGGPLKLCDVDKDITSLQIPEGAYSIKQGAFSGCKNLKSLEIPESLSYVETGAFQGCYSLEKAFFLGNTLENTDDFFYGNKQIEIYCYEFSDIDYWASDLGYHTTYLDDVDINEEGIRRISLPANMQLVRGQSTEVIPNVVPSTNSPAVEWNSSDPTIISVINGKLTALNVGTAVISATLAGTSVSTSMQVKSIERVESFDIEKEVWLVTKQTYPLRVFNVVPQGAETSITWVPLFDVFDEYLTIDENGVITGKKPGEATYIANDACGVARATNIHVCYPVSSIDLEGPSSLYTGEKTQYTANVIMRTDSCVNHLVTFSSSDEAIAVVDESGMVTALGRGTVEITAQADSGVSASCVLTVKELTAILTLPQNLRSISSEAFSGLDTVEAVRIPESVIYIADDAFLGSNIVIFAPQGSYAIQWAEEHGIKYIIE